MKIVCYKAVFRPPDDDTYDVPFPPECPPEPETEFVIFANVPAAYEYAGWHVRPGVFPSTITAKKKRRRQLQARMHKVLSHILFPDADFTLWLDGPLTPITAPSALVDEYASDPDVQIVSHRHPARSCLYAEAQQVVDRGKDDRQTVEDQVARYRREHYPADNGLAETGALLRRNSPTVSAFNELWWDEIERGSIRDQLSFDYCRWRQGVPPRYFRGVSKDSPHFRWRGHRYAREHPEFRWLPAGTSPGPR